MLINGKNDDIGAIVNTAINEYNALMYIVGAVVLSAALCYFLVKFLAWNTKKYSDYVDTQLVCSTWYPKTKKTQWITGIGLTVAHLGLRTAGAVYHAMNATTHFVQYGLDHRDVGPCGS